MRSAGLDPPPRSTGNGFGFITYTRKDGSKAEVFVHHSKITTRDRVLFAGDEVTFFLIPSLRADTLRGEVQAEAVEVTQRPGPRFQFGHFAGI